MQPVRVLGIDPGLATVGYAVLQGNGQQGHELLEAGVINTPPKDPDQLRLKHIHEETVALIEQFKPQAFAVEKLFFKKNVTTGIGVAQARGVLLLAACGLPLFEYTPMEIKRRVAGSGRAQKFQVQAMVQRLLGLAVAPRPDDAADAVAVALCYLLEQRTALGARRLGGKGST